MAEQVTCRCDDCGHSWSETKRTLQSKCPACGPGAATFHGDTIKRLLTLMNSIDKSLKYLCDRAQEKN